MGTFQKAGAGSLSPPLTEVSVKQRTLTGPRRSSLGDSTRRERLYRTVTIKSTMTMSDDHVRTPARCRLQWRRSRTRGTSSTTEMSIVSTCGRRGSRGLRSPGCWYGERGLEASSCRIRNSVLQHCSSPGAPPSLAARGRSRRRPKAYSTRSANHSSAVVEQAFSPTFGPRYDFRHGPPS
jgi:hypothetical protein